VLGHPVRIGDWTDAMTAEHSSPLAMVGVALLVFPEQALGMSGFGTGVTVMPQVKADPTDMYAKPAGRIHDTRKLLTTAAVIMSGFLPFVYTLVTNVIERPDGLRIALIFVPAILTASFASRVRRAFGLRAAP
jgi:hypothetical protein